MHEHASLTFPEECCGLLLGKFENDSKVKRVLGSRRMTNVFAKEERYHRYTIDPKEFMEAEVEAESNGMDIVGIYHSHPNAAAKPSQFDMNHAWPSLSYIVIEVRNSKPLNTKSWLLREDRTEFLPEDITVN
jgi:proteasome lid subunit RPN8/RPN11